MERGGWREPAAHIRTPLCGTQAQRRKHQGIPNTQPERAKSRLEVLHPQVACAAGCPCHRGVQTVGECWKARHLDGQHPLKTPLFSHMRSEHRVTHAWICPLLFTCPSIQNYILLNSCSWLKEDGLIGRKKKILMSRSAERSNTPPPHPQGSLCTK